jgi:hypothetical protein
VLEQGSDAACLSVIVPPSGDLEQRPTLDECVATLERDLVDEQKRIDSKARGVEGDA